MVQLVNVTQERAREKKIEKIMKCRVVSVFDRGVNKMQLGLGLLGWVGGCDG
jgi:hypothetical protein